MSAYVRIRNGMSNAEEDDVRGLATDFIIEGGVVDLDASDLLVEAQDTPDMSVKVAPGVGYVPNSSWTKNLDGALRFWDSLVDEEESLVIGSNSSGSTRIDLICLKVDTTAVPDADASNVASLVVVAGTPGAGVPATPSNHLKLAEITVANGETTITSAEINDTRTQVAWDLRETKYIIMQVEEGATDLATGDGKAYFTIPPSLDGFNLTEVHARVVVAGTTGTTDIQIHNVTQAADMLSTKITIDSTELSSSTAATPPVINASTDDVAENDLIRVDIDAVSTTEPKGLIIRLGFRREV